MECTRAGMGVGGEIACGARLNPWIPGIQEAKWSDLGERVTVTREVGKTLTRDRLGTAAL